MTLVAQSADGVRHEFPDGTDPGVIDRAMKQYAQARQPDPYAGKSLQDIQQNYRQLKLLGADQPALSNAADAYVRREAQQGGLGLGIDTAVRQLASGVPIVGGLLDEANAGTSALMGGSYDEALDYNRARDRLANAAAPGLTTGLNIAGGVAGTLAGTSALGIGAKAAGPLLPRMAAAVPIGAGVAAADQFGRGEGGLFPRLENAAGGAVIGGLLGPAAPLVGSVFGAGTTKLLQYLNSADLVKKLGIPRAAANLLIRQLGVGNDSLGAQGQAAIKAAGPDAMLADAGQGAKDTLDTALQMSGASGNSARDAIRQRTQSALTTLQGTLNKLFGKPVDPEELSASLRGATQGERDAAYSAAYAKPIDYSSETGQTLQNLLPRVPGGAIAYANALMKVEGKSSNQILATIADDGSVTFKKLPDVRQWDYIKRALDAGAAGGWGDGALRGNTAMGKALGDLAREVRTNLSTAVPEYDTALASARDPIRLIQNNEFGNTLFNDSVTPYQVRQQVLNANPNERRSLLLGARQQLNQLMGSVRQMASDPNTDANTLRAAMNRLTSVNAGQKIEAILGPQAAAELNASIKQSMSALSLRASVATNSRTAGRQALAAGVKEDLESGPAALLQQGHPLQAAKGFIQQLTGMDPASRAAARDKMYGQIADALTRARGPKAMEYLQALRMLNEANTATTLGSGVANSTTARVIAGAAPSGVNDTLRGSQ